MPAVKLGLIVNPLAGLGGPLAFKGSDAPEVADEAAKAGVAAIAPRRATEALRQLAACHDGEVAVLSAPREMGEEEAQAAGFQPLVVGSLPRGRTTAADTRAAAQALAAGGVDLLLFAGGDGTAVDVLEAIGARLPVLGVPAGVKMHSAVFAVNPLCAGLLTHLHLAGGAAVGEREVLDVDEDELRLGAGTPRLRGYLRVPYEVRLVQDGKSRSPASDRAAQLEIASHVVERVLGSGFAVLGPGTTTGAVADLLDLDHSVVGVDVLRGRTLYAKDVREADLDRLVRDHGPPLVIVAPVGGQGFLFGRGNAQIGARFLRSVSREQIVVLATESKLAALAGRPLLVDTGDAAADEAVAGYVKVITGYGRTSVYRVAAQPAAPEPAA